MVMESAKGMPVHLRQLREGLVHRRFTVNMHAEELDLQPLEVWNVGHQIHKVGEL
jgi:hypothetical protein